MNNDMRYNHANISNAEHIYAWYVNAHTYSRLRRNMCVSGFDRTDSYFF
jgi:hypothetical protein